MSAPRFMPGEPATIQRHHARSGYGVLDSRLTKRIRGSLRPRDARPCRPYTRPRRPRSRNARRSDAGRTRWAASTRRSPALKVAIRTVMSGSRAVHSRSYSEVSRMRARRCRRIGMSSRWSAASRAIRSSVHSWACRDRSKAAARSLSWSRSRISVPARFTRRSRSCCSSTRTCGSMPPEIRARIFSPKKRLGSPGRISPTSRVPHRATAAASARSTTYRVLVR